MGLALGPSEILTYLATTGTGRFDPKSGLTKPRVDLGGAVGALGTWVDFAYSGSESGTPSMPFNTLLEGINASPGGGARIFIRAGTTSEALLIQKAVTLVAVGGTVSIGG